MAGELCAYPGSHYKLSEYFRKNGFDDVAKKGKLPTGDQTDKLFGGTMPTHCIGKAGDVFIANYMTAHFIAPNTAAHIRYAVYFRVTGRGYDRKNWQASMVDPCTQHQTPATRRCRGVSDKFMLMRREGLAWAFRRRYR